MRILLGLSIFFSSVYVGHVLQLKVYEQNAKRYRKCVTTGRDAKTCSVLSVFRPDRFNEVEK